MPETTITGMATKTYGHKGMKIDGKYYMYAPDAPSVDVRPSDTVKVTLDESDCIRDLEVTQRGDGKVPEEKITDGQKAAVERMLDDQEKSVEELDERLLWIKGKRLADLNKVEAGGLMTMLIGRENNSRRNGRHRR